MSMTVHKLLMAVQERAGTCTRAHARRAQNIVPNERGVTAAQEEIQERLTAATLVTFKRKSAF